MLPTSVSSRVLEGAARAALVLVGGLTGIVVWRLLVQAGAGAPVRAGLTPAQAAALRTHMPPGWSVVCNCDPTPLALQRLGASLLVLLGAIVLGALVGLGCAAVRAALTGTGEPAGRLVGGAGWLGGMLWTPPVPLALTVVMLRLFGPSPRGPLAAIALAGLVAVLVAVSAGEPWRRGRWAAGAAAAMAAACRATPIMVGALVVVEAILAYPGIGTFLYESLVQLDTAALVAAVTPLLAIALVTQVAGSVAADAAEILDEPPAATAAPRSPLDIQMGALALATLAVPAILLLASAFASSSSATDIGNALAGPSASHLLGTDELGRDLLALLLVGFRLSLLAALAGALVAVVAGGIWGALAAILARASGAGPFLAEALLAPGRVVMVAPLLIAGAILAGTDRLPLVLVIAIVLAPRVAVAVAALARGWTGITAAPARGAAGTLLCSLGVALGTVVGLQVLGLGTSAPTPSLGGTLGQELQTMFASPIGIVGPLVVLAATAPFLVAGWALLRNPRRGGDALAVLEA